MVIGKTFPSEQNKYTSKANSGYVCGLFRSSAFSVNYPPDVGNGYNSTSTWTGIHIDTPAGQIPDSC